MLQGWAMWTCWITLVSSCLDRKREENVAKHIHEVEVSAVGRFRPCIRSDRSCRKQPPMTTRDQDVARERDPPANILTIRPTHSLKVVYFVIPILSSL